MSDHPDYRRIVNPNAGATDAGEKPGSPFACYIGSAGGQYADADSPSPAEYQAWLAAHPLAPEPPVQQAAALPDAGAKPYGYRREDHERLKDAETNTHAVPHPGEYETCPTCQHPPKLIVAPPAPLPDAGAAICRHCASGGCNPAPPAPEANPVKTLSALLLAGAAKLVTRLTPEQACDALREIAKQNGHELVISESIEHDRGGRG